MSAEDCVVAIEKCGCITYTNARPDELRRSDERRLMQTVKAGGRIERMASDEARKPDFLPFECPHDPKGWMKEEA